MTHAAVRRARRTARAALLALASLLGVLGAPVHLAAEALAGHDHVHDEPAWQASCPSDCSDPEHAHRAHDHAACPACRALALVATAPEAWSFEAPDLLASAPAPGIDRTIARAVSSAPARGPPSSG